MKLEDKMADIEIIKKYRDPKASYWQRQKNKTIIKAEDVELLDEPFVLPLPEIKPQNTIDKK